MSTKHLRFALLVAATVSLLGAAVPEGIVYSVIPTPPTAGGTVTVEIDEAPETPIRVEFWLGGGLIASGDVDELPGSSTFAVPAGSAGKDFEVRLVTASESATKTGVVN